MALKNTTIPASVLFSACTAIATMPFFTATLFTSEFAKYVRAESSAMCTGCAGLDASKTSTKPFCALTTNKRLLAASYAGISAALLTNTLVS